MEVDKHRTSHYHTPVLAVGQARSASAQSMRPPHHRSLHATVSPKQNGYQKNSNAQHYFSTYTPHELSQSSMVNQLQPASAVHALNSQYNSYPQNNNGSHHVHTQSGSQHYPSYTTTSLPPLLPQYEIIPQYSTRPPMIPPNIHSQYLTQAYTPSNNQMSVCMDSNASLLITSQPDLPSFDPVPFCRPEISTSFVGYASNYEFSEQDEAQPEHELSSSSDDARPTKQQCELTVKPVFDAIIGGRLHEASTKLLAASQWFSASVVELGFHLDNEAEYESRLSIWRNINHCWEALAQKQNNILQQELRGRRKLAGKLPLSKIQRMMDDFLTICDNLEEFGLVDYEMGIWEEQIVHAFVKCVDLQEKCDALFPDDAKPAKKLTKRLSPNI